VRLQVTPENQNLLYADETGELVGVVEVQLMDEVPKERIEPLHGLLSSGDTTEQFHALLVLLGWGDELALQRIERVLNQDGNPFAGVDFHRLYDTDLTYDRIADALSIGFKHNGLPKDRVLSLAKQLLDLSSEVFFQNGLEMLLTAIGDQSLTDPTEDAVRRLVGDNQMTKASDLLPALATLDPKRAWAAIDHFKQDGTFVRTTSLGVARTLARITTPDSRAQLQHIKERDDLPGANDVAAQALEGWPD